MEELASFAPLAQLGATGVLLVFIGWMLRAIARGDWVSKRELDYVRADRDARVAEKDREIEAWQNVAATERVGREIAQDNLRTALGGFSTLDRFFNALREVADRRSGMGEGDGHAPPGT